MMGVPSGLGGQFGFKSESTYGTAVVVDKFVPYTGETLKTSIARVESKAIISGRRGQHHWRPGMTTTAGPLPLELYNKPMATWMTHLFGSVITTGVGPYVHTSTFGELTGKSFTAQVGRPAIDGTVHPFTWAGCKIPDWEISANLGEIAKFVPNITAKSETTATGLATASYLSGMNPFVFTEAVLSVAGSSVSTVSSCSIKVDSGLKSDRGSLGQSTINQQLEHARRSVVVTCNADFESLTHYARYAAGSEIAIVFTFTSGSDILAFTLNASTDGDSPTTAGESIIEQPLVFRGTSDTSDAALLTAVLTNGETVAT